MFGSVSEGLDRGDGSWMGDIGDIGDDGCVRDVMGRVNVSLRGDSG